MWTFPAIFKRFCSDLAVVRKLNKTPLNFFVRFLIGLLRWADYVRAHHFLAFILRLRGSDAKILWVTLIAGVQFGQAFKLFTWRRCFISIFVLTKNTVKNEVFVWHFVSRLVGYSFSADTAGRLGNFFPLFEKKLFCLITKDIHSHSRMAVKRPRLLKKIK